ncbi:Transmembrane protein [Ceratobasidium theobromae]|uniref:Transmembrane protein n=1 Tax=Ceratobasidium theobromae TaxID=1582974 RepID=A0A5N5QWA3_9AGAM|nr:Transmembrane protein [Ceratobasidium theobromae]
MSEIQFNNATLHDPPMNVQAKTTPLWVPILVIALSIGLPILAYLGYIAYFRLKGEPEESQSTSPNPDLEKQSPDAHRPSTSKWKLHVPRNPSATPTRRGSDGGFPPETRHITLPDPTLSTTSVDSYNHKVPLSPGISVLSPKSLHHPTPPIAVRVNLTAQPKSPHAHEF